MTMAEIPNIPGMRRDIAASHPMLYKQFKASHPGSSDHLSTSFGSGNSSCDSSLASSPNRSHINSAAVVQNNTVLGEDNFNFSDSYYSAMKSSYDIKELTLSIQSFPTQAESYNDLSGRYSMRSQQLDRSLNMKALPYSNLDSVPHFVANGKEPICRVLAYYTEKVPYNGIEQERARKMEIMFFLEDSTIEIIEPYIPNCGIVQGTYKYIQYCIVYLLVLAYALSYLFYVLFCHICCDFCYLND